VTRPARAVRRDRPAWQRDPVLAGAVGVMVGALVVGGGVVLGVELAAPMWAVPQPAVTVTVTPPAPTPTSTPSPSRR